MSTEFFNDQWRIPSNDNQNKVSNYSMDFNGSSDKIEVQDASDEFGFSNNRFSLSAWVFIDSNTTQNGLIAKRNIGTAAANKMWYFEINTSSQLRFLWYNTVGGSSNASSADTIPLNTWTHVVVTSDGTGANGLNFYINGSVDSGGSKTGPSSASSIQQTGTPLWVGVRGGNSSAQYTSGKIDQVTVFDYALSQDQVTQLGAEGYAFNFNGSTQAIDCGAGSRFDIDQITISGWVKLEANLTNLNIIGGVRNTNNGIITYMINHYTNGKFRFIINQSSDNAYKFVYANDDTVLNTWYHVVGVADGSNVKMYVNGELQTDQTTYDGTITSPTQNFNIGRQPSNPLYYLDGELSNISVFNTGLTGPQVTTLYNSGKPLADMSSFTSLQGWWKLDDTATFNSVWSIPDDSSNSNTGTSVGMNASNLVASNINGELIANPMITSPKPIAYYQLGDQSVDNGANYLVPNNSLSDYVFNFDGTDDYLDCGDSNTFSFGNGTTDSPFSISAWVNPDSTAQFRLMYKLNSTNGEYLCATDSSSKLSFLLYNNGGNSNRIGKKVNVAITTGWQHWTFTYDGTGSTDDNSGMKMYINGVEAGSYTSSNVGSYTAMNNTNVNLEIGAATYTSSYANGKISNVSIFNTELSSTQVTTLYNNGAPNDISSLSPIAWYKLNAADTFDGSTSTWTINDYGSGGNDGTSVGMTSANLVTSDLQQTSGYSPYALDFDGIDDYLTITSTDFKGGSGTVSYSFWIKPNTYSGSSNYGYFLTDSSTGGGIAYSEGGASIGTTPGQMYLYNMTNAGAVPTITSTFIDENVWNHIVVVFNTGNIVQFYKNGALSSTLTGITSFDATWDTIAARRYPGGLNNLINANISNIAFWNVGLTSTQVTEIYNEGVPSNLNNFSGTAPVAWWQLGSNSSYNSGAWTCLDEIGTNNAVSVNMTNDDIVDGPGYSASGLGASSIDIKGDAPYSTANGLSENMDVLDRTTDVPS